MVRRLDNASLYEQVVASCDEAIVTESLEGIITSWNPAAERLFGYASSDVIGLPMSLVYLDEMRDEESRQLAQVAGGEPVSRFETMRRHRCGLAFQASVTLSPLRDSERVVGVSAIVRDITELVERDAVASEMALESRLYASIVDSSDDAIITKDLQGIVTSWNPAAEQIFGYGPWEMIGQPMTIVFPEDRLAEEHQILDRISRGEKVDHFETVRKRKDGSLVNISATISPIVNELGKVIGASKIARDITQRVRAEQTIWTQANFDALTQLPNRRNFQERLRQELARATRTGRFLGVMFIDLDRFKEVNDTLGHQAGDTLLVQASQRIQSVLREIDNVARMGGDEFTVLLPDMGSPAEAAPVAERINKRLFEPFSIDGVEVHISGSIGIAVFPKDGNSADELLQRADQAMYESKRLGRNQTRQFVTAMESDARGRMQLVADLRHALVRDELRLVYQPVVELASGQIIKCEALLRWQHPEQGDISPAQFIPLAEESGLIVPMGEWVFRTAAQQVLCWRDHGHLDMRVAINVSPLQLQAGAGTFERWINDLASLGLPGSSLIVEITEGMMIEQTAETAATLRTLRRAGVQVAIDDFGTGYSSLSYLSHLDINYLKIDQIFTSTLGRGTRNEALCEAIIAMAHKLGLLVIAEGVESSQQFALLRSMGCDLGQGYHFSKPDSPDSIERLFASGFSVDEMATCR